MAYLFAGDCRCDKGILKYWYDDFDKLSAKDKLGWLKYEYDEEYEDLTKEDKMQFIEEGWCYCRTCEGFDYSKADDDPMKKADEWYDEYQDSLAVEHSK